jgi:hypothetical protein
VYCRTRQSGANNAARRASCHCVGRKQHQGLVGSADVQQLPQ